MGRRKRGEESNAMKMGGNGYDFFLGHFLERGYNHSASLSFSSGFSFSLSHLLMNSRAKACMKSEFGGWDLGKGKWDSTTMITGGVLGSGASGLLALTTPTTGRIPWVLGNNGRGEMCKSS
jgi:hypothetical protein